jgi:ABC-type oligopeptide transport system, periplasmic component
VFIKTRQGENKQIFRGGWIADYNDPINYLQLFESRSRFNYYGFKSPEYDALVEQLRQTTDDDKRQQLITEAEAVLAQVRTVYPAVFLCVKTFGQPKTKGLYR